MEDVQNILEQEVPSGTVIRASKNPLTMHHEREVDDAKWIDDFEEVKVFVKVDLSGMPMREALREGAAQLWRSHVNSFRQEGIDSDRKQDMLEEHRHSHLVRDENGNIVYEKHKGDEYPVFLMKWNEVGEFETPESRRREAKEALIDEFGSIEAALEYLSENA